MFGGRRAHDKSIGSSGREAGRLSLQTLESSVNESSEKYTNAVWRAAAAGAVAPSACGGKF